MDRKERQREGERERAGTTDIAREIVRDCQRERKTNKHRKRQRIEREERDRQKERYNSERKRKKEREGERESERERERISGKVNFGSVPQKGELVRS